MSKLEKLYAEIVKQIDEFKVDAEKLIEKSNQAAGRRARVKTSNIQKLFKEFRKQSLS